MTATHTEDVKHLNSFLRGEISAVETYQQALAKLKDDPGIAAELSVCRASHQERVERLKREITRLGGKPAEGSGVWGGFARLFEGGAKAFGTKAAIAALEEGEDHGKNDYQRDANDLSPAVAQFVRRELVPEQHRTHDALSRLKQRI